MIDVKDISKAHFLGIGGIGMSAIARYFSSLGIVVSGYDRTPTDFTALLESEGMSIHYTEDVTLIPKDVDMVVYTPAIPADNVELIYCRSLNVPMLKRSELLGIITHNKITLAIGGTHGKTTITSMVAHILYSSGRSCTAFIGGICLNYQSNFIASGEEIFIVEADEYDRSFLHLFPTAAIITSTDADHLDIYGTVADMKAAYCQFAAQISHKGILITHPRAGIKSTSAETALYSMDSEVTDITISGLHTQGGDYCYDIIDKQRNTSTAIHLRIGGLHNVENTVAAFALCRFMGIEAEAIATALDSFKGIQRRFEYLHRSEDLTVIDDYAHHPEELSATIRSVRSLYPHKKMTLIFQPHLYSRTRDLCAGFIESLHEADQVLLMEIYPARELPLPGITAGIILDGLENSTGEVYDHLTIYDALEKYKPELLVITGAGDIGEVREKLTAFLLNIKSSSLL